MSSSSQSTANISNTNTRPMKRKRTESYETRDVPEALLPLPVPILLLTLPSLLIHPPSHRQHLASLSLSARALRRCIRLQNLEHDAECRAWTALAEIGILLEEDDVEQSITKALLIAQKHPALRFYKYHLTILSAQVSSNNKYAQNTVRRLINNLTPLDPPHIHYMSHLALIALIDEPRKTLLAIRELTALAVSNHHQPVIDLTRLLSLQVLVNHGLWSDVPAALKDAEHVNSHPMLTIHVLILSVVFHTYAGQSGDAMTKLAALHAILDGGSLPTDPVVELIPNLPLRTTHPRIIYLLVFLLSSVAKRDPVGRKPKRKVFAMEGLLVAEKEARQELPLPLWASHRDLEDIEGQIVEIKADFMCELIGNYIARSEFDEAETTLAELITHTRQHDIFDFFSARITLHHAHLAHALGRTDRALQCYRVAAHLASNDKWVCTSARAGEVWIRIGILRAGKLPGTDKMQSEELETLRELGEKVAWDCDGLGGTLKAIGEVLRACLAKEYIAGKTHLRQALNIATEAQDSHLKALILALVASHYLHTARSEVLQMLETCEQLAAGLGARPRSEAKSQEGKPTTEDVALGNVHLRLWVGEQSLELHKWAGDEKKVARRLFLNEKLRAGVAKLQERGANLAYA